jgi:diguanylate cyclase (GGDEF)-like protein/PAS domain S-box-containing protein
VIFRPRASLRLKVVLVLFMTSAIALAMACAAFVAYEYSSVRSRMVTRLGALAGIVGENCKSALVFGDRDDAERTLSGLRADSRLLAAAVYSREGQVFASFARLPGDASYPALPPDAGAIIEEQRVVVSRPILEGGRAVGTVYLVADLTSFEDQFREFARAGGGVLLLALLVAALLAYRLQRIVTDPVLDLVQAAKTVAASQDLKVRVTPTSEDELGLLAETFNGMLAELEHRDSALRESEARYALSMRGAQDGLWDWNLESGTIFFAPRWKEMLGFQDDELPSRPEEWLDRIHPEDRNAFHAAFDAHISGAAPHFGAEYRLRHRNGSWLWAFARGLAIRSESGTAVRIAGSQSDITDRKGRDALTGLPNRLLFVDRVERWLRRERGPDGVPFAVLVVELERLDLINETLGRRAGRDLLLAAAERIQKALARQDTLASLDSGRFALLLEIREAADASRAAEEIHRAFAPPFLIDDQEHFTAVAIGIAFSGSGYELAEEVVRDALAALTRARDRGWNQTEVFDERMRVRAFARLDLEDALRRALDRGELTLHYQPILALQGRRLAGFEALLRWERGDSGFVPTSDCIALAEDRGLIVPLGGWVLREACRQLYEWRTARPAVADFHVSVNISAHQLTRLEFIEEVESALDLAGIPASCLKLEITESIMVEQAEPARTVLHELHRLGVGLWLDDFGTGYSNLSYLHRMPIEAIKIDRSFVGQLDDESQRREIVGTLVALARNLGMQSIAEGVETARQLERLALLDCDFVQGHVVSHPLAAREAAALLRTAAS